MPGTHDVSRTREQSKRRPGCREMSDNGNVREEDGGLSGPQQLDIVTADIRIPGHQNQVINQCLGNKDPIEWITVV